MTDNLKLFIELNIAQIRTFRSMDRNVLSLYLFVRAMLSSIKSFKILLLS